jgi:hypothetical protein
MSQTHESHEEYMKRRIRAEEFGVSIEYNTMRLTKEIQEIKEDIKKLQIDVSHIMRKYE